MNEKRIRELCEDLEFAVTPGERFPLLEELSRLVDPADGKTYATELLSLAVSVDNRKWKAVGCVRLADCEIILAEYPLAGRHLKQAKALLEDVSGHLVEKAQLYRACGYLANAHKGDAATALEYFRLALEYARQSGNLRELAITLSGLGGTSVNCGHTDEAIEVLDECLELSKAESLLREGAEARTILAMMSINAEDWENAEQYLRTGLAMFREAGEKRGEAAVYEKLGYLYACRDQIDEGLKYYRKSAAMFRSMRNQDRYILTVMNIGFCYVEQGKYDRAQECMDEVVVYGRTSGNDIVYAFGLIGKGDIHVACREWEEGIEVLSSARKILGNAGAAGHLYRTNRILAGAFEETGRIKEALDCYREIMEYERNVSSTAIKGKILTFPIQQRLREMTEEKEVYRLQKEDLERESERRIKEMTVVSMQIAQNNELLDQLRERLRELKHANGHTLFSIDAIIREIDSRTGRVDAWNTFEHRLQTLDPEFLHQLTDRYPSLTPAEMRVCSLLKISMTNKDIAALLNVSDRTVDTHRTSIRKKMGLRRGENLVKKLTRM